MKSNLGRLLAQKNIASDPLNVRSDVVQLIEKVNTDISITEKMDLMYEIFRLTESIDTQPNDEKSIQNTLQEIHHTAEIFLQFVLDIEDSKNLHALMQDRLAKRDTNPEYIPGIRPDTSAWLEPHAKTKDTLKSTQRWLRIGGLLEAKKNNKVLVVNAESQVTDTVYHTKMLSAKDRQSYRVILHDGKFYQLPQTKLDFKLFNTKNHISHEKVGFGAYTINIDGELSVFKHYDMAGSTPMAHSSINAGKAVFAAGELKIEDGALTAITVHSGHYLPMVDNIYHLLHYLKQRKVNLDAVKVYFVMPAADPHHIDEKMGKFKYVNIAETLYQALHKEYQLKQEKEKNKVLPFVRDTVMSRITDLKNQLNDAIFIFPQMRTDIQAMITAVSQINAEIKGGGAEISKQQALVLPMLKNKLYDYVWNMAEMIEKMPLPDTSGHQTILQQQLQAIQAINTHYKNFSVAFEKMKNIQNRVAQIFPDYSLPYKKILVTSLTDFITQLNHCLKLQKGFLGLYSYAPKQSNLKTIIDNFVNIRNTIQKIDANRITALPELQYREQEIIANIETLLKPSNQAFFQSEVKSLPDFDHVLTSMEQEFISKRDSFNSSFHS